MKQIIAMGGGGFSMEPDHPLLDQYILAQSGKERPKVCFIPTASGDADGYIERFYEAFKKHACEPTHLPLFRTSVTDLEEFLLSQDILYVGGGNTRNLLALWKEWGVDQIVKQAWEKGIILAGISAGGICWFEEGESDSNPGGLSVLQALGFLPGSFIPHYDGEAQRRPATHKHLLSGWMKPGIACDDGAAVHFIGTELHKAVSSRPHAKAYKVELEQGKVVETPLMMDYLGEK